MAVSALMGSMSPCCFFKCLNTKPTYPAAPVESNLYSALFTTKRRGGAVGVMRIGIDSHSASCVTQHDTQ